MTFRELVRRYQRYDPLHDDFTAQRSDSEYARMLGVGRDALWRFYAGHISFSRVILSAFLRTFPQAANEVSQALMVEEGRDAVAV